jgi:hypothetical protein
MSETEMDHMQQIIGKLNGYEDQNLSQATASLSEYFVSAFNVCISMQDSGGHTYNIDAWNTAQNQLGIAQSYLYSS